MTSLTASPDQPPSALLDLLGNMNDAAYRQMDQNRMMDICLKGLIACFQAEGTALMVKDYEQSWMLCIQLNCSPPAAEVDQLASDIKHAYQIHSGIHISQSACTIQIDRSPKADAPARSLTSWTAFPLQVDDHFLGLLYLDLEDENAPGFSVIRHHLCTALIAMQSMRQLLITDPMTGCYNRWFMDVELSKFCESDRAITAPFAVMLVDVDHFKQINDGYGHAAGDQCLVMLADQLRSLISGTDAVIRMGGDEFLLWIPEVGDRDMGALAETLRRQVSQHLQLIEIPNLNITLSIGIVVQQPDKEEISKETLLDRADQALYYAKRTGRNRATLWHAALSTQEEGLVPALPQTADLTHQISALESQIQGDEERLLVTLEAILNAKQYETGLHSIRVTRITRYLVEQMDFTEAEKKHILRGARLHDIGKVAIPDAILNKQGTLSEPDWTIIRQHTLIGYRFIKDFPFLEQAAEIVLHHHEAYDGSGYPHGLKAEEIPLGARLFSLVDAYDSMRANRIYKPFIPKQQAMDEIRNKAGTQFDPQLAAWFLDHIPQIENIGHWDLG